MDDLPDFLMRLGLCLAGWVSILLIPFGLPGNWLLVVCGLGAVGLGLGWPAFGLLLAAAAFAEYVEFCTTLKYAKKSGAGTSGLWGAFLGAVAGAIAGTPIFPLIGTLLGAAVGAFAGAAIFEMIFGDRPTAEGLKVGKGAFFGALIGRVLKIGVGVFQAVWLTWVLWFGT